MERDKESTVGDKEKTMTNEVDMFGDLPVETRNEIKAELEQLDYEINRTVQGHIAMGKHFTRVKELAGHGLFLEIVKERYPKISIKTIDTHMQVYKTFGLNYSRWSNMELSYSVLREIVRLLVEAQEQVKTQIESGETLTVALNEFHPAGIARP
ncbi:MAG: hypothetical protein HQL06_10045 [Nitrospirae bacterium]|nr:hypothetical protein [Nitrospirota bacterium]